MARFLSSAWFDHVGEETGRRPGQPPAGPARLILQQVVVDTPDGDVAYHVTVTDDGAVLAPGRVDAPDLVLTSDYPTAAAVARGVLSTQAALLEGRIRVRGNLRRLGESLPLLEHLDLLPESVRRATTFEAA